MTTVFIVERMGIGWDLLESVGLPREDFTSSEECLCSEWGGGPSCLILDVRLRSISGLDLEA